ncbi:MAG TPA: methyltransferase domain-containing protein [Acidimicrobiia bacterium]|jgi:SAM-dependent methyltransferase
MAVDEWATRATSFGAIAEDYDRYRPGPPIAAAEWVLPRQCDAVVDIGAGTGALTRLLVQLARRVTAVEPDPRMAAVLAARVPEAVVLNGRAEQLPLPDGGFDALVGSSMWHWVDEPRAATEAARVLRPGGVFGLLWTGPDRTEGWLADLMAAAVGPAVPAEEEARRRQRRHAVHLPDDAPFGEPETHVVRWSIPVTPDDLVGLAGTYSRFIVLPEAERAELRERVVEIVRGHPAIAGREQLELPMGCRCWRAVRLS